MFKTRFNCGTARGLVCTSPSLTQQQFKESQSIDAMIRRAITGDSSVFRKPQYLDVLAAPESMHDAQNRVAAAKSIWNDLPESVRQTYGSPEALLADYDRVMAEQSKAEKKVEKVEEVKQTDSSGNPPAQTT